MFRRLFILSLTLLTWLGALTVLTVSQATLAEQSRGVENPLTAEMLPFRVPRLGVTAELRTIPPDDLAAHLSLMQQAGITWVRQYAYWDILEPERGVYVWDEFDRVMQALADFPSLRPVIVFQNSPAWAIDPDATDPTGPPTDPNDFAAFVTVFSARYGAQLNHYQIWDEPNLFTNWGGLQPRAARYAAMLEAAYHAIHSTDPAGAVVLSGALAPTVELGPDNISDWVYLRDLYTLGAHAFFDAVGAKPYGFDSAHDDRRVDPRVLNFSRVVGLRDIMREHGDAGKAIWGGHWGWNSLPPDWQGNPSTWGAVSQADQIQYTLGALERIEREWPWMAGVMLHHWNPPYPANHPQQGFALTTPDGQPTALLQALIDAHRGQSDSAAAGIGWHPAKTPYARYSGLWTFTEYGADIGWQRDSRLQFTFAGQTVGLILRQDNYVANLYPTINGNRADALPMDADGRSYLTLTSDTLLPQVGVVPVARQLPDSGHTLEVIADQGFDRYALMGYAVGAPDVLAPLQAQRAVAFLTVLVSSACVLVALGGLPWSRWYVRLAVLWRSLSIPIHMLIGVMTSLALMLSLILTWGQELPAFLRREPVLPAIALMSLGLAYLNLSTLVTLATLVVLFWCIYHRLGLGLALT
ncbi:MAG: beta-galactosidase, partial [Anaerolineae bacterium]|nr:beta-galactosidase [Anaerolineae bacterium]